jgi:hypothetical protein
MVPAFTQYEPTKGSCGSLSGNDAIAKHSNPAPHEQ